MKLKINWYKENIDNSFDAEKYLHLLIENYSTKLVVIVVCIYFFLIIIHQHHLHIRFSMFVSFVASSSFHYFKNLL